MSPGKRERLTGNFSFKLAECNDRAGERDRADKDAKINFEIVDRKFSANNAVGTSEIIADPNQYRCCPDEAMQHRDKLRHGSHGYARSKKASDNCSGNERGDKRNVAV